MLIEYLSYIATFIISAGIAVIGIMVSYQNFQSIKKPILSILLYQQIFLFSFFIYGIWGNLALHQVLADISLSEEVSTKLAFFIPVIGTPFMVISWFMLLKFSYNSNGYNFSKIFIYSYFPLFITILFILAYLVQNGIVIIPENADLFIVRIIVGLNLLTHVVFIIPFLFPRNTTLLKEIGLNKKWILIYFSGVIAYSIVLSFFNKYGFISICLSIIILFITSVLPPIIIKITTAANNIPNNKFDFQAFCKLYEISKREAEIVLEICDGKTNKAIAEKLFITLQTVKDHNHRIFVKTNVKSRVQLSNLVREKTGLNH